MIVIPLPENNAWFTQTVDLDGRRWRMDIRWNTRAGQWLMDISNDMDEVVVAGIRLVALTEMLRQYRALDMPPGALYFNNVLDPGGPFQEAGLESLPHFQLTYITEEEWDEGVRFDESTMGLLKNVNA